jgi:hypothetical protein
VITGTDVQGLVGGNFLTTNIFLRDEVVKTGEAAKTEEVVETVEKLLRSKLV